MSDPVRELMLEQARAPVSVAICSVCRQVAERPDLRGTMWGKPGKISMSFSAALIQIAGGLDRLLAEWTQEDPRTGRPL